MQNWRKSEFLRSVSTLLTGTLLAQLFTYLLYPLLTRIYSAEEMGELALYLRWVAFIAAVASARYEIALPLPKKNEHAFLLFRVALRISFAILGACLVFATLYYFLVPHEITKFVFTLLTILSAYITVWINLGIHWSIRTKKFKRISTQKMVNSLSVNSLRWIFGIFGFGSAGLIIATVVGSFVSILVFLREFWSKKTIYKEFSNPKKMVVIAKEYKAFPFVNLPHNLLDLGVDLIIAELIVFYFDKSIFGSYSHAYLMLKIPLALIGQSVGQVFFNRCSDKVNINESIYPDIKKLAKILFLVGIIPFTVLFLFGEPIFGFVFGEKWFQSGRFAEDLSPLLFFNFVLSPLSVVPIILRRQKEAFVIGIFFAVFRLVSYGLLPLLIFKTYNSFKIIELTETNFQWLLFVETSSLSLGLIISFFLYLSYASNPR